MPLYRLLAVLPLALLGLAAPAVSQAQPGTDSAGPAAVGDDPARPGDVVRLRIWREPELSGDFPVEEDGVVVLPRLGRVDVTRESPTALRRRLSAEYGAFLQHSSVSVSVLRRVQITGAVRNPGLYPVDATMTVADALALAGGTTPQGKPNTIRLVRGGQEITASLAPDQPLAGSQLRSGDQLYVPERSFISRNATVVSALLTAAVTILVAVVR